MRTWKYAVTYEFTEQAPVTVRGEIAASALSTAALRACKAAKKTRPGTRPASIVIVLGNPWRREIPNMSTQAQQWIELGDLSLIRASAIVRFDRDAKSRWWVAILDDGTREVVSAKTATWLSGLQRQVQRER